ncbi:MAG: competence/damage-inducible protein A [Firmicutes bacterium HGW-Firmicutes-13]|nr:MAG: competence/damage-inducible protein A [Firmicutes bacterium HGW-Firmicutes-13]
MKADIINVGDEVLLGYVINENAAFLSQRLASVGVELLYHTVVGDQAQYISSAFRQAWERADLILFTGGLGTTVDDLTKEVVSLELGLSLEKNEMWEKHLKNLYQKVGMEINDKRLKQAYVPQGCTLLPNENGTAAGLLIEKEGKIVILLPGPPDELKPMVQETVIPYLISRSSGKIIKSRILKVTGLGEATLEDKIYEYIDGEGNPRVVLMAQLTEVHIYITVKGMKMAEVENILKEREEKIRERLGSYIYGVNEETMEEVTARHLLSGKKTLATAESFTGGLLANKLTNIPGSSNYFLRGIVCYSNEAKNEIINVPWDILNTTGAVSEETARYMAENVRSSASADYGLSTTGYAGPSEDFLEPVGLAYIGLATPEGTFCQRCSFWGDRKSIKEQGTDSALNMLRLYLQGSLI